MAPEPSQQAQPPPTYPLYNTTFTLHRLSPLHIPPINPSSAFSYQPFAAANTTATSTTKLTTPTLRYFASQFRDLLAGDVLRGVRVGLAAAGGGDEASADAGALSTAGALRQVRWRVLAKSVEGWEKEWESEREREAAGDVSQMMDESTMLSRGDEEIEGEEGGGISGLLLEIVYEEAVYVAILLREAQPDDDSTGDGDGRETSSTSSFVHYPLLLTRMPAALRSTLLMFLSDMFDTHASPLRLSSPFIESSLENWFQDVTSPEGSDTGFNDAQAATRCAKAVKEVLVTLGIDLSSISQHWLPQSQDDGTSHAPGRPAAQSQGLKSIDITISKEDVYPLLERGRKLTQLNGHTDSTQTQGPFVLALQHHISAHLALDFQHQGANNNNDIIKATKVACAGFVLGGGASEGRVKVFDPQQLGGSAGDSGDEDMDEWEAVKRRAVGRVWRALVEAARGRVGEKRVAGEGA